MGTRSKIWYGTDELGRSLHIYWELAERVPKKSAPIYLEIDDHGKELVIRLPKEIASQIRDFLSAGPKSLEVM